MNISIDDLTFGIHQDVKTQTCNIQDSSLFFDYHNQTLKNDNTHYFYLFETCFHLTFGHWVYESAIYLPYFLKLKLKYPKLKLLVNKNPTRNYKKLIFDSLNIESTDIYWLENEISNECTTNYKNIPENNICIHTNPYYLNMVKFKNKETYSNLVLKFQKEIFENLNIQENKQVDHMIFKRSVEQNYTAQEVDYNKVHSVIGNNTFNEYDPMETKNFKDQIMLLLNSKNIYLPWGASFVVNGLFCKNSNIYVYGKIIEGQKKYDNYSVLYKIINEINNNTIIFL